MDRCRTLAFREQYGATATLLDKPGTEIGAWSVQASSTTPFLLGWLTPSVRLCRTCNIAETVGADGYG